MRRISRPQTARGLRLLSKPSSSLPASRAQHAATAPPTCAIRAQMASGLPRPAVVRLYSTSVEEVKAEEEAFTPEIEDEQSRMFKRPPTIHQALSVDKIEDASYAPATSGLELEEVGGIQGFYENDQHWDAEQEIVTFAPRQKIWDPAVLEVLARRAVVEAVIVQTAPRDVENRARLTGNWTGLKDARAAYTMPLHVAEDGTATTEGAVGQLSAELASADHVQQPLEADEAKELLATYDPSWKNISLKSFVFRWAVAKRIYQLTGHLLPDAKMNSFETVQHLLSLLIKAPKPKKLADELSQKGELEGISNVTLYNRRVTPIDKHKMVGRWKVIVEELEKRELPTTGTGGHSRSVEKRWLDPRPHTQRGKLRI